MTTEKFGTDFFEEVSSSISKPRIKGQGQNVVIHGDGSVRFHQRVLDRLLAEKVMPENPRVLVRVPSDEKTIRFQFVGQDEIKNDEFKKKARAAGKDPDRIHSYKYTKTKKGFTAKDRLRESGIKQIVDTITYYKSESSRGQQHPDKLEFTDPVVDTEELIVTISTDNIKKDSPKD